jgi:TPP-dependent pyruvate/acetoin dehydrogenase alpha subunit
LIRAFEQKVLELFSQGQLMGTSHTCLGQEANACGVAAALRSDDIVVSNHRCHGHFLAHVGDVDALMAELMGRASGVCGGWGGSQHLCRPGVFYSNGIQGGIASLATGLALGQRLYAPAGPGAAERQERRVVVVFLGDGTMGQGAVYESFNLASVNSLPLLFVVEDNEIAQTTPSRAVTAGDIGRRAQAFDIEHKRLDYPAVDQTYATASGAVAALRAGRGPQLLWLKSVRLGPHSKGDDTRSREELERCAALDPLPATEGMLPAAVVEAAWRDARARVDAALTRALSSPHGMVDRRAARSGAGGTSSTARRPFAARPGHWRHHARTAESSARSRIVG